MTLPLTLSILGITLVVLASLYRWWSWQFDRRIAAQITHLTTATPLTSSPRPDALPSLIRNFGVRASPSNHPPTQVVRVQQTGAMLLSDAGQWVPFPAIEYFSVRQPGFLWRAHLHVAPLIDLTVIDRYSEGQGALEVKLSGAMPLLYWRSQLTSLEVNPRMVTVAP